MTPETSSHKPEEDLSGEDAIFESDTSDSTEDELKNQLDESHAKAKSNTLRGLLKEFGTGFAEQGSKDIEGVKKVPEALKKFFSKESWRGAISAIKKDPSLLYRTAGPIVAGIGVAGAAKWGVRQLTGAPGLAIAAVSGAAMGGRRAYIEAGRSTEVTQEQERTDGEKIQAIMHRVEAPNAEASAKSALAKKLGATTYGALRGATIASAAYLTFSGLFGASHEPTATTEGSAVDLPEGGIPIEQAGIGAGVVAESLDTAPVPEASGDVTLEDYNYSGGELDPNQALQEALKRPDLEDTLNALKEDDAGTASEQLFNHGIDADFGGEPEEHALVNHLQAVIGQENFQSLSPEAQQSVVYEIMSYPEQFNNPEAVAGLIENAQNNLTPENVSDFVANVHADPGVNEAYVSHLQNAAEKGVVDSASASHALENYATTQEIDLAQYGVTPESLTTANQNLTAGRIALFTQNQLPVREVMAQSSEASSWKKILMALGALLGIGGFGKMLSKNKQVETEAPITPDEPEDDGGDSDELENQQEIDDIRRERQEMGQTGEKSPDTPDEPDQDTSDETAEDDQDAEYKEKLKYHLGLDDEESEEGAKKSEFSYEIEGLVSSQEIQDFLQNAEFNQLDTEEQKQKLGYWLHEKRLEVGFKIPEYEDMQDSEEQRKAYEAWDWQKAEEILDQSKTLSSPDSTDPDNNQPDDQGPDSTDPEDNILPDKGAEAEIPKQKEAESIPGALYKNKEFVQVTNRDKSKRRVQIVAEPKLTGKVWWYEVDGGEKVLYSEQEIHPDNTADTKAQNQETSDEDQGQTMSAGA
ncbi:hypothetical protein ACFL14_00185 [Patescibacteria group bacterium]